MIWLDNFAKILAHTFIKADTKAPSFSSNLWTAAAVRKLICPGTFLNFCYLLCVEGCENLHRQPTFGLLAWDPFWASLEKILKEQLPTSLSFFTNLQEAKENTHRPEFLKDFYPFNILGVNISSNLGLATVLRKVTEYYENTKYSPRIIIKVKFLLFFLKLGGSKHLLPNDGEFSL